MALLSRCSCHAVRLELIHLRTSCIVPAATLHQSVDLEVPPTYEDVEFPPVDPVQLHPHRLRQVPKVPPPPPNMKPPRPGKGMEHMRGPEEIHNTLIHKQFGIVALQGGRLKYGHFEMMRQTINRALDTQRMFAVWRVDPPWWAITKKSQGSRMGGGKGSIHHYVTPVRAGRVILEVGGKLGYEEVRKVLENVALKMPVYSKAVTHEMMEKWRLDAQLEEEENLNPFTMKYIIQNNMGGVNKWTSPYDYRWFCKYR